jgi:hypothetical protein
MEQNFFDALKYLRERIPQLVELLKLDRAQDITSWVNIVEAKLLSRLSPDFPIVAAICGGGSSGKSTLFNSLLTEPLAPTGGRAGMNRRVLFSVPKDLVDQNRLIFDLVEPFKIHPQPLKDTDELTTPGSPLYVTNRSAPSNFVLLDTPDFDTGARGRYVNRDITRMALEASDIMIYIFTNSNYNNRDNTDFMAQMLTGIGRRKCFLIYRVYPSFNDQEVHEHAMTVARGIYGDEAESYLLGIYRADEDNRVAAGDQFMELRPITGDGPDFFSALESIDAPKLRFELHSSILIDALKKAEDILKGARLSLDELRLYLDAFQAVQSQYVHEALKHFPMDRVVRRFAKIWSKTDPAHIKIMRKTGNVIEFPIKLLFGAAGWAKERMGTAKAHRSSAEDFLKKLEEDLVTAVTSLHSQAVGPQISVSGSLNDPVVKHMSTTIDQIRVQRRLNAAHNPRAVSADHDQVLSFFVDTHPVVLSEQKQLRDRDFKSILKSILSHKDELVDISQEMDKDLRELADHFRNKMQLWDKVSQTFWASLNVLPATVAVTYVLSTGDPVGAAGIKVKLTGLFGAKDLYALFAIPVTTRLKKADQQQIETMLGPIAQTWFNHKLKKVQRLFEQAITAGPSRIAKETIERAAAMIEAIETHVAICAKELNPR